MEVGEGDSKKRISNNFDLKTELSALVENKVISSKIAEKLEQKLIEKDVKLNQDQLNALVQKIKETIKNYPKFEQHIKREVQEKTAKQIEKKPDEDMLKLVQKIEQLEEKINNFEGDERKKDIIIDEQGLISEEKEKPPKFITQDDIKIPKFIKGNISEYPTDPLIKIPTDPESIIILMKWLQHLIDKCGHLNLSSILDYYVDIDWISQDVKISLIDYSHGITDEKGKLDTIKKEITDLPSKDHIQSYIFIQKLKGNPLDKHFIDRIENDISRITKKISDYQFK